MRFSHEHVWAEHNHFSDGFGLFLPTVSWESPIFVVYHKSFNVFSIRIALITTTNVLTFNVFRFMFIIDMFLYMPSLNKLFWLSDSFFRTTSECFYSNVLFRSLFLILLISALVATLYYCNFMLSGVSGVFQECAVCHKSFKMLSTHIALSPTCEQVYATTGQQDDIPPDAGGESNVPTRRSSTRNTRRLVSLNSLPRTTNGPVDVQLPSGDASVGIGITIQQQEDVHNHIEDHYEDGGFASLDEHLPWSDDDADTSLD